MSALDELRAALEGLTEEQASTVLGWIGVMRHERHEFAGEQSVGALGDLLGMQTVARAPGRCTMRLEIDPAWHNPNGVLHGGVVYTLIDYSMGGAIQPNLGEGAHCATIEVKINYLAPVREGTLTVETVATKEGRNIAFLESKVNDQDGKLIATASGSMFIFRQGGSR